MALGGSNILLGVAEKWPKRLFTKNTGLCESVKRCIGTDTCPVPEGQEEGLASTESSSVFRDTGGFGAGEALNSSPGKRRP